MDKYFRHFYKGVSSQDSVVDGDAYRRHLCPMT